MGKTKGHGARREWKRQPAVNRGEPGKVLEVWSHLFPAEWRAVTLRMRDFDTAWFAAHPGVRAFVREYVPGECYPKHAPEMRYVMVQRAGNHRVRAMLERRPAGVRFVELPAAWDPQGQDAA